MRYYSADFYDLGGQRIYVSRTGYTNELGFELYCEPTIDHKKFWNDLVLSGAQYGMEMSSTRAMTVRRIEGGIRENLVDMDPSVNPFEVGLGRFVDLDKKEFIGRKALLENSCDQLLFGIKTGKAVPEVGMNVLQNGKEVGTITSGTFSPTLDCGIGFVRFKFQDDWRSKKLEVVGTHENIQHAEIVDLPFFDKTKGIPKV